MDILIERADGVLTIALQPARQEERDHGGDVSDDGRCVGRSRRSDASVRAMLLRGNAGIFSAGNDLEDFMKTPPMERRRARVPVPACASASAEKPVVAAVTGAAVGIGTTMLLHCDLVYAADRRRSFSLPFVQLGLCPEAASSLLLPRIAGYQARGRKAAARRSVRRE